MYFSIPSRHLWLCVPDLSNSGPQTSARANLASFKPYFNVLVCYSAPPIVKSEKYFHFGNFMAKFDPAQLRALRQSKHITAVELAKRMATSPAQIHRLEKGLRRLTVDALLEYCSALDVEPGTLLSANVWVPITGLIDSEFEVQPVAADVKEQTLAPPICSDMSVVAALRWAARKRFQPMHDHVVFYQNYPAELPEIAWNKRCLVTRADGSQCLGWPIKDQNRAHIDVGDGPAEFNVAIKAASPVIAVMPPFAIQALNAPPFAVASKVT